MQSIQKKRKGFEPLNSRVAAYRVKPDFTIASNSFILQERIKYNRFLFLLLYPFLYRKFPISFLVPIVNAATKNRTWTTFQQESLASFCDTITPQRQTLHTGFEPANPLGSRHFKCASSSPKRAAYMRTLHRDLFKIRTVSAIVCI